MCAKTFLFICFLSIPFTISTAQAANSQPLLPIQHWATKNGTSVYFVAKTQVPIVDFSVVFRAGSAYDNFSPGIAQFTAQMLAQGTRNLNADQIANRFESAGAQYNTAINQDMVAFHLRSLSAPQFFNSSFNTFLELLTNANFPQAEVNRLKKQIQIALQQQEQTPTIIALKAFYKILYGKHPYASPLLGTTQSIEKITSKNLENFYNRHYFARNAMINIVGNITKTKAINLAEQLASALPQQKKLLPLPTPLPQSINYLHKFPYPSHQVTILLGQIGITLQNNDYFPLLLGNQILGGGILTSKLFTEVRNKRGLSYGINSNFTNLQAGGPFIIGLQTRKDQAFRALSVTEKTLKNFIAQGPAEVELIAAKQALVGSFPLTIANNANILRTLEKINFYNLPLNYLDSYQDKLDKVTIDQVRDALQKHINPEKLFIIMVGVN